MKIEFLPAAPEELIETAEFYESDVRGLRYDFMSEVERVIGVLMELPSLGQALIFRLDGDVIRVVAVAHRRRRPRYWAGRVHDR